MDFLQLKRDIPQVSPEIVFDIFGFPISSSFLMIVFITILFLILGLYFVRRFKLSPSSFQVVVEIIYNAISDFLVQIMGSKEKASKIFPLIATLFIFIGISNLITIVPGLTSITWNGVSIFRSPTTDFNTTFSLALAMIILVQIASLKDFGILGYIGRFIKIKDVVQGFKKGIGAGFTSLMDFAIGLLDIISEVAKVVSLSLRLFGNIYAGEVLMIIFFGAIAYVVPSLWLSLSILFGVVQAVVFGALTAAYYSIAVKDSNQ